MFKKACEHFYKRVVCCKRGGSGGTEIHYPSAPQPQTTAESMADYVESLPALYEAQMQYAPQMVQQQIDMMNQYGTPYGQAVQQAQAAMYPETTALQEQMAGQASEGMEQGLTDDEMEFYRDQYAANLGTNAGSGIGADYMGRNLMQANQQRQDYYRNLGLSLAGRQQLATPQAAGQPQWMQGYQPSQSMGYQAQQYGAYTQATRPMVSQQGSPFLWGLLGNIQW